MKKYLLLIVLALVCTVQTVRAQSQAGNTSKKNELPMPYPDKLVKQASSLIIPAHIPEIKTPFVVSLSNTRDFISEARAKCASQKSPTLILHAERINKFTANLKWETKYAYKASGFNIERSLVDTSHFENINFALAKPGAGIKRDYQLPDRNDYSGVSFYRIKQLNSDAGYMYSNIVAVKGDDVMPVKIYPNPASEMISIEVLAKQSGNLTIDIYDASGKIIQHQVSDCTKDMAILRSFDVSKFASGVYQVKILMPDKTFLAGKFIKD